MASALPFALPPAFYLPRVTIHHASARGIRSIARQKPSRFNVGDGSDNLPVLASSTAAAIERRFQTIPPRSGAIGVKKGMSAIHDPETGYRRPCTIIQFDRVEVVAHKTRQKHGYYAVQVGSGWKQAKNVTRPMLGYFASQGVSPKRHLVEFMVKDETGLPEVGTAIGPSWFKEGQYVDVRAKCRGMGFEGGMKRHGFGGQPASHGTSLTHRALGSAGQSQGGGSRVYPGKRMPGNMGGQQVTVHSLKVLKVDEENGLLVLNGCVPGHDRGLLKISDSIKKPWPVLPRKEAETQASQIATA